MLTGAFRRQVAEKVDILDLSRKSSTPGSAIPETTAQSQVECLLIRKSEDSQAAPATTQEAMYRCYLFSSVTPTVSQLIKRSSGERLTVLTKPEKFNNIIFFDCRHTS